MQPSGAQSLQIERTNGRRAARGRSHVRSHGQHREAYRQTAGFARGL